MSKPQPAKAGFAGESLVQRVPLDLIFPDENQVRRTFDEEALEQLAASIREHGVIQPVIVRPRDATGAAPYDLIAGERRWRASKLAGAPDIPALIRVDLVGQDISVLQILENLQRVDLPLPETAAGVAKLVAKIGNTDAAKQLGKSEAWVSKHARIGELPDSVRQLVEDGRIESADVALDLAKAVEIAPSHWMTQNALRDAEAGNLTRQDMRRALDSAKGHAEAMAKQRDLLENEPEETPEEIAERQRQEELREARQREWDAQQKKRDKREQQVKALNAEFVPLRLQWLTAFSNMGLTIARDDDTGQIVDEYDYGGLDEGCHEAEISLETHSHGEKIPKTLQAARFRLEIFLSWDQLNAALTALGAGQLPAAPAAKGGDSDVATFIAQRVDLSDEDEKTRAADVHAAYVAWCKKRKGTPLSFTDNRWGEAIAAAGIDKKRMKDGYYYLGVRLA